MTSNGVAIQWNSGPGRYLTSYASNWHAMLGGWDQDWQYGGVASIPRSFPDGLSNTIGYFERYAICGDPANGNGSNYIEHIWGEDGQNSGPVAQAYNGSVFANPSYHAWISGGIQSPYGTNAPKNYPQDWLDGVNRAADHQRQHDERSDSGPAVPPDQEVQPV